MLKVNIQLFAHKKGMAPRTAEIPSPSVSASREATVSLSSQATCLSVREVPRFIPAQTSARAATIRSLQPVTAFSSSKEWAKTVKRLLSIP